MSSTRSSWLKWLILVALIVALAVGLLRALNKRKAVQAQAQAAALAAQEAAVFQLAAGDVVILESRRVPQTVAISGSLKATRSALIKARTPGEVSGISKREGEPVSAGEVLARIDSTEARARVEQAQQQAASAQSQVVIAQRAAENNQALVQKGFISATALETSSANLSAAQANHQAAMAALDIAKKTLADTTLRAPLSGQIAARLVQNGERVGVDARIFEVIDLSSFEMEAALPASDAAAVRPGQTAQVRIEGLANPVRAEVDRINPNVQAGSRSVQVYLRVPTIEGMRQGLFAQGSIETGETQGLVVPLSAVRNDKPEPYVQWAQEGKLRHVEVALDRQGTLAGEPVVVIDSKRTGLKSGDTLLRAQAGAIREGTAVQIATSAMPAAR
ncbi:MAG: efflux RND transporter periplasmic adaptor subunit [Burkholderiaceae bacterium]